MTEEEYAAAGNNVWISRNGTRHKWSAMTEGYLTSVKAELLTAAQAEHEANTVNTVHAREMVTYILDSFGTDTAARLTGAQTAANQIADYLAARKLH